MLSYIGLKCVVGERTEKFHVGKKQRTVKKRDAFEITVFERWFEIVQF
jgi:hypothetical protein